MDMLKEINHYREHVKKNNYVYTLQKQGINLLYEFMISLQNKQIGLGTPSKIIDYFLSVWIPRNKRYLTEAEAFNIVYTLQDFQTYLEERSEDKKDFPLVLDLYRKDYVRLYRAKKLIDEMVGNPIISTNPIVIDLENYKGHKEKKQRKDTMCMYEQGIFRIEEVNKEGYLGLVKLNSKKHCKVLCRPTLLYHFKEEDLMQIHLKKKIFFIYWEIEELKAYYPSRAIEYL